MPYTCRSLRLRHLALAITASLLPFAGLAASGDDDFQLLAHAPAARAPARPVIAPWSTAMHGGQVFAQAQDDRAPSVPAASPVPANYGRLADSAQARPSARLEIRLQQARFDPLLEAAPVLPGLAGNTVGAGDSDYHLVQFSGPIRAEWQAELARRGLRIIDYVPDFAYIVRADSAALATLDGWDAVRWRGPFLPAYRLAADLLEPAVHGGDDPPRRFLVRSFAGERVDSLLAALRDAGARVVDHGDDTGGGVIVEISAAQASLRDLAHVRAVAWIERKPQWKLMNAVARSNQFVRKDLVEQVAGYFGEGEIVAVTDTGLSTGNPGTIHADFQGRVVGAAQGGSCGSWAGTNAHGTHVAGSVLGSGVRSGSNPAAGLYSGSNAGIAPRAGVFMWATCDDFSNVPMTNPYVDYWAQMYGFNAALRTDNNSWGSSNDADQGTYNSFARETDRFLRDYPDMVAVFAAGNGGTDADWDGVSDFSTTSPPSTAKNVISVGASESLRASGGYNPGGPCGAWGECWPDDFPAPPLASDRVSNHPWGMAAFSGRGPTYSNRLKPDIVAPGTNIVSARSEVAPTDTVWGVYNQYYLYEGGTSMASPLVAGGAAIVRQYFRQTYDHNPSASLVKAALINAASDMSPGQYGAGPQQDVWRRPDINQGWGRMDVAATVLFGTGYQPAYYEGFPGLQAGQYTEMQIGVQAGGPSLRFTLAWLDAPGLEASHGALVNDLDLEVVTPGGTILYGFAGNVGAQRDRYNNFEEVAVDAPAAGNYTVRVRAYNVPLGPQSFSLVATGNLAQPDAIFRNGFD